MRVFVTGASGFIGRQLCMRLLREGHEVVALTRNLARAQEALGAQVELVDAASQWEQSVAGCDAAVNLAGTPIATRWTSANKRSIKESRVDVTERLVAAMGERCRVLLSASAVGIYGTATRPVDESTKPASDFAAWICDQWERAASQAPASVRVCIMRLGLVLGVEGGVLGRLEEPARLGLLGRLGSGEQGSSWVHLDDVIQFAIAALEREEFRGAYNLVAPERTTNLEFSRALAARYGRGLGPRVPAFALRIALGKASSMLVDGPFVEPKRLMDMGWVFSFADLGAALEDLVDVRGVSIARVDPDSIPKHEYLSQRPPRYVLEQKTLLDTPLENVFPFFQAAHNLGALTPPALTFQIQTQGPIEMGVGQRILYQIRLGGLPMKWLTQIERWEPGHAFVDAAHKSPYASWYHEHLFEEHGSKTFMVDRVYYRPPFGLLGRLAHSLVIRRMLTRIFRFRARAVAQRFG